jgi:hypothetical protein
MSHPLDGARLKVHRANEHLLAVNDNIRAFLAGNPYRSVREVDPKDGTHVFHLEVDRYPSPDISAIIGDCVHNLHSALDYIAWELVKANGQGPSDHTKFPLYKDASRYAAHVRDGGSDINKMSPEAQHAIERFQPYHGGDTAPLDLLYELSRWDKHREILLIASVSYGFALGADIWDVVMLPDEWHFGPLNHGDVFLRARYTGPPGREEDLEPTISFVVSFNEAGPARGQPVTYGLESIHNLIGQTLLPTFERLL